MNDSNSNVYHMFDLRPRKFEILLFLKKKICLLKEFQNVNKIVQFLKKMDMGFFVFGRRFVKISYQIIIIYLSNELTLLDELCIRSEYSSNCFCFCLTFQCKHSANESNQSLI